MSELSWNKEQANLKNKTHDIQGGEKKVMKKSLKVIASATLAFSLFASVAMAAETTTTTTPSTTTSATTTVKTSKDFTDLAGLDAALLAKVDALLAKGYMDGKTATTFDVAGNMTRAEAAKLVAKIFGLTVGTETTSSFKDVDGTDGSINWAIPFIEAAKKAGIIDGMTDTTFAPKDNVTLGQLATLLVKGFGKGADVKTTTPWYQGYLDVAKAAGVDLGTDGAKLATRADLVVGSFAADLAVQTAKALSVDNVTAVDAKTLKLTFSRPVVDTTKVTFAIKNGDATVTLNAKWATDKKSVTFAKTADTNLETGTYTITASGDTFVEGKNAGTVKVEDQKVTGLSIPASTVKNSATASVKYVAKDQYGNAFAVESSNFTWVITNITATSTRAVTNVSSGSDTSLTLKADAANLADSVMITGILNSDPSIKVTTTLTVSDASAKTFELSQPVLPTGATRLTQNAGYVKVPYTSKDSNGYELTLSAMAANENKATVDGITFVTSDPTIIPVASTTNNFTVDASGNLNFKVLDKSGTVLLTAINSNTGTTNSITVVVNSSASAKTLTFGTISQNITSGDAAGTALLPVSFTDQFGNVMTAPAGKTLDYLGFTPIITSTTTNANLSASLSEDGKNIVFNDNAALAGDYTLNLVSKSTGQQYTKNVTVKAARVAKSIEVTTAAAPMIAKTGSTSVTLTVKDQYGQAVTTADPTKFIVTYTKSSGANTLLATPTVDAGTTGLNIATAVAAQTLTAGSTAGSETITYTLRDVANSKNLSSVTVPVTVVDVASGVASYGVDDVATLFTPASGAAAVWADAFNAGAYNKGATVYGKDANGNRVALSATETNALVYVPANPAIVQIVSGNKLHGVGKGETTVDVYKDGTLATKVATIKVVVDNAAPVVTSIAQPADKAITIASNGSGTTVAASSDTIKDQYGVDLLTSVVLGNHTLSEAGIIVVSSNTNLVANAGITVVNGHLQIVATDADGSHPATPVIISIAANGTVKSFKVTVTDLNDAD